MLGLDIELGGYYCELFLVSELLQKFIGIPNRFCAHKKKKMTCKISFLRLAAADKSKLYFHHKSYISFTVSVKFEVGLDR
jgi:hypothetical protein